MSFSDNYTIRTNKDGIEVAVPKEEYKKFLCQEFFNARFHNSGIPEKIKFYDIKSYVGKDSNHNIPRLKKYVENFEESFFDKHLYLWSRDHSYQKTTCMGWVGKELCKKFIVRFVLMNNLIENLTQYKFNEESAILIDQYADCDLLLIDDSFVKERVTLYKSNYQLPFADSFLRERLEVKRKATIFTSNRPISEIGSEGFGNAIQELVKRNCYEMEFKDSILLKEDFNPEEMWK